MKLTIVVFVALLAVALFALSLAPPGHSTYNYGSVGAELCAEHGGVESEITSGPDTIITCVDGTRFIIREVPPPAPNVGYEPDPPPVWTCAESYYDEEGWHQGDC